MPKAEASWAVILFHVVARGRCWIGTGQERHWAEAGDVIVLPYGDAHRMGGASEAEPVSVLTLIDPPPWASMPVIRHGRGGERTDLVCGYLACDDPLFDPRLRAFPSVFVVRPPDGRARDWVRASIEYAADQTSPVTTHRIASPPELPEVLLREVLKLHLAGAPAAPTGWMAALRDPVLAPTLAAIHESPQLKWTVADLARIARVSATVLDERFREVLGVAPIRYLTGWRMHVAEGPARRVRPRGGGDRPARRLRVGGGVQPRVQTQARPRPQRVAGDRNHVTRGWVTRSRRRAGGTPRISWASP
ncbi:cupin domain-containing protein [Actinokineospora sp.]|uniref:AraC family transcriptional regulator n=1 Tax=Actinokineospora sp. TaxID=1872133 RepID=UPI003D6BCC6E